MHLIAAIFSFLFSFGHAQTVQAATEPAPVTQSADYTGAITDPVPSRDEIRTGFTSSRYAGNRCSSCSTKNDVVFIVHSN